MQQLEISALYKNATFGDKNGNGSEVVDHKMDCVKDMSFTDCIVIRSVL